jgi:type IV pilus assembly protein PilY1
VTANDPYPDFSSDTPTEEDLEDVKAIWQAGKLLADRQPDTRDIFTYVDTDQDHSVDEGGSSDPLDDSGEVVRFHTANADTISPYLGVKDDATWSSALNATSHADRVDNVIEFVRGEEITGLRTRSLNGTIWKLGDIVHSTPVTVSKPFENFHTIYQDESYHDFYNAFKDRETVVYVGANDGMLHAFTSWNYNATSKAFTKPSSAPSGEDIGRELWGYVPQHLLPHLKWLPSKDYSHVYYMDQKPKLFEAKILPDDAHYTDSDTEPNWGTFLLAGMRMGGGPIQAEEDFDYDSSTSDTVRDFASSYVCLDVTEPRDPRVMWERTYDDLGFSMSRPAVVKVKDSWFAVFGSGPQDYDGTSAENGHVFVVDLKTGQPYTNPSSGEDWLFDTGESDAFINSPVSLDKNLNYSVDAIYFGETYHSGSWKGRVYKMTVPWVDNNGDFDGMDSSNYIDDPKDTSYPWYIASLFDVGKPVTAPLALSIDSLDNAWVFGGTGRYLSSQDKTNTDTQYLFGVKDPFYNEQHISDGYYHSLTSSLELEPSDLFNPDPFKVTADSASTSGGQVFESGYEFGDFEDLLATGRAEDGWIKTLQASGERVLDKPAVFGGILFAPTFIPNDDVCGYGGQSNFYGLYYETGTAYKKSVFSETSEAYLDVDNDGSKELTDVISEKISIGAGKGSSLGVHVGREQGAKAFIQLSTGNIKEINVSPAFNLKSGLQYWKEK